MTGSAEVARDLLEETLVAAALLLDRLELAQQLLLALGQLLGHLDEDAHELVAAPGALELGQALVAQAEDLAALRAGRDRHLGPAAQRGDLDLVAQRELVEGERQLAQEVRAVALEDAVLVLAHDHVQVAARRALVARVALLRHAQAQPVLDTGGDLELDLALLGLLARAAAVGAGVLDRAARSAAARTGGREREEALVAVHLAAAAAGRAHDRLRAGLGARALAGLAALGALERDRALD